MLSISLSKKTFGIKNKTLLRLAAIFHIATFIVVTVSYVCEVFFVNHVVENEKLLNVAKVEGEQEPKSVCVIVLHFIGSTVICFLTGFYILSVNERFTKKQSIRLGCITIFHILFLFNPWIVKYQKGADDYYFPIHVSVKLYYILICCCLVIAAFICWLPWQNQSMRKKPNYKVIYGGNDTKKMPVVTNIV
uniref:Cytochrome b561 domain-containing protein n=1 Tax=Caenorhabditis tropicalis TaxID=1561998 RepID=A0A1I7UGI3_9PELO